MVRSFSGEMVLQWQWLLYICIPVAISYVRGMVYQGKVSR